MALTAGTLMGPYEILSSLGAGGMGEVYRAKDAKLKREVAIKVLPADVAGDRERLARFQREAEVLASLNHPNIAQIYGLEELPPDRLRQGYDESAEASAKAEGGSHLALVMELVEGQTLDELIQRSAQGPSSRSGGPSASEGWRAAGVGPRGIPIDDALAIARQIAEALEAAHERGVIHRDLKPANIKVRGDGVVKVLDFGLAKALDPTAGSNADLMHSPTITSPATQMGMILGTAAYMAPEQAKGRAVDRRADIWAFGVVLLEMLTGRRVFEGGDISEVLASVLKDAAPLESLPAGTPACLRRLLRRCLEKDRAKRLDSMADARLDIEEAMMGGPDETPGAAPAASPARRALPWAVVALALLAAAGAGIAAWRHESPPTSLTRLQVNVGADVSMWVPFGPAFAIAPDGRTVVVAAGGQEGAGRLYVRSLDRLEATPLQGTENAVDPFISPDGLWVGFFAPGKLRRIAISGGAAVDIAPVQIGRGAWWGEDGNIYFTPTATAGGQVLRVPASGGTPAPVGAFLEAHVTQRWPQVLPGGKALIYTGHTTVDTFEQAALVLHPLDGGPPRELLRGGYHWRYVSSGHIVYIHAGTLFAVPFDLERLAVTGAGMPVVEGILSSPASGGAQFGVSPGGMLAYVRGANLAANPKLSWLDLAGTSTPLREIASHWESLSISPDGTQLAVDVSELTQPAEIWIFDLTRDTQSRLTINGVADLSPLWTRDGTRVVFASAREGPPNLFWQRADGSGPAERLLTSSNVQTPTSWHPDGRRLLFGEGTDLHVLTMPEKTVEPFLQSPANEGHGAFSPDGRWVAYASDESGQFEVYVRPFPSGGGRWPISTGGAAWPMWSPRTRELYYVTFGGGVMAVPFEADGPVFRPGKSRPAGSVQLQIRGVGYSFGLHPDGRRFVSGIRDNTVQAIRHDSLIFVLGFADDLKARIK